MSSLATESESSTTLRSGTTAPGAYAPAPPAPAGTPSLAAGERFVFLDALRGVAAVLVLLRHLFTSNPFYATLRESLPRPIQELCYDGMWGVHIFFVLSGFVIAHSLRNTVATPRSVAKFILRRQLRLDPLYWFVLAVCIATLVARHVLAVRRGIVVDAGVPTAGTIFANVFYLHNILRDSMGTQQIVGVSWTLCIEVQFYLFFIFCLAAGQFAGRLWNGRQPERNLGLVSIVLVTGLGLASMTVLNRSAHHPEPADWSPWFTGYWYYFAAGALACWGVHGRVRPLLFGSFAALFIFCATYWRSGGMATGAAAATLLFLVGTAGRLGEWLNYRPMRYMGQISYSLYMMHTFVVLLVMNGGYKLTHASRHAGAFAIGWMLLAAALSILVAHATYLWIERPSLRFSERFKERRVSRAFEQQAIGSPEAVRKETPDVSNLIAPVASRLLAPEA